MGFFSWMTADTNKSVSNRYSERGPLHCYVICPDNTLIEENDYEGYGIFGGHDIYALFARWNMPESCTGDHEVDRMIGVSLKFSKQVPKYPIKIIEFDKGLPYDSYPASEMCPNQGYFY